jgi:hypothetical protein
LVGEGRRFKQGAWAAHMHTSTQTSNVKRKRIRYSAKGARARKQTTLWVMILLWINEEKDGRLPPEHGSSQL